MKKAILFDLDDTLYDYEPAHQKALKAVYPIVEKEMGIPFKKFERLFDLSKSEIHRELAGTASSHNRVLYFQRLIEKTLKTLEPKITLKLYNTYWDTFLKSMKLKKGVLQTLKKLKKEFKIIILSDLTAHIQLKKINKLGLTPYIDFLVTSEEAGIEKPHPSMFLLALNKVGILPFDAIMIGDNPNKDVEGANSVGIDSVLISNKVKRNQFSEDYKKPDYIIKEIPEILRILEDIKKVKK